MTATNWIKRHLIVLALTTAGLYLFHWSRGQWSDMHRWNRAFGDISFVLVALAMFMGPMLRLTGWRWVRGLIPYRRELGIYAVIAASVHTAIILVGWVNLDFARLFGFEFHPALNRYVMVQYGFALANLLGIAALLYGVVLAATSNDFSLSRLGTPVWKFVQQGAYVLWWLIVLHTAYFLFLHFLDFHRQIPEPNWAQWPFVAVTTITIMLQLSALVVTWRRQRQRIWTEQRGDCG
ncbi:ferric reductase-like transmembrane domain-containing protein [Aliiroseovarius sp. KMU-50]|uniref:Ferric reductase-like transmembrane domain-containing protein n=1 Tax=Aliiroseovarius salicola TaxID=3009082 RepID=A0ABT4W5K6_9RHOB|nr:ferric reductase-like transmembrane domain-containing protein [Aliiroseovarius sp. KMU-50]MDA5095790.1 ferric reductase-like transmembrane domain-containing protein [Aliiroseovarius sp. KMU-50]